MKVVNYCLEWSRYQTITCTHLHFNGRWRNGRKWLGLQPSISVYRLKMSDFPVYRSISSPWYRKIYRFYRFNAIKMSYTVGTDCACSCKKHEYFRLMFFVCFFNVVLEKLYIFFRTYDTNKDLQEKFVQLFSGEISPITKFIGGISKFCRLWRKYLFR